MLMTDKELQYILAIAEERNVTHAAEKLHLAQPSLTQTLRKIEGELGCPLFIRRKYGLDPTPAGELYLSMAKDILERMNRFEQDIQQLVNPLSGKLTIGASWYNTLLFLSDVIHELSVRFPQVEISLVEKGTNDLEELFASRRLDIFLAHEYPTEFGHGKRQMAKDVRQELLLKEPFCLVAHEKFGLGEGTVDLRALEGMPFISFNDSQRIRRITDFAFANAGISVKRVVRTQSFPGAMELAERGIGLTVLPLYYVRNNLAAKPCLHQYAIDPAYHAYWSACVYYRCGEYPDRLTQGVLPILRDAARQLSAEG